MKMTVREFLKEDCSIDICDDVCEELYIAFVGPAELTVEGEREFALILEDEVEIRDYWGCASYNIRKLPNGIWEKHLETAIRLFGGLAGYCSEEDYDKWFKEANNED